MSQGHAPLPTAESDAGLRVLKALLKRRTLLAAMEVMRDEVGNCFQITLPRFQPAVLAGSAWNRTVLVSDREQFHWRVEKDPVTSLLRHGILVEDGEIHDRLRRLMEPSLRRGQISDQTEVMIAYTDQVIDRWKDGAIVDMLVEMRRVALLILFGTLFKVDFSSDMDRLWKPILKSIKYISPGWWILWPEIPRPGYRRYLTELNNYLFRIIRERRVHPASESDFVTGLIAAGLSDDLVRDQMLTMLIAGHDTSTALLSWTLFLLGSHPEAFHQAQAEVDSVIGSQLVNKESYNNLRYLDQVIKEALRLFPPIHVGNRINRAPLRAHGYEIPENSRIMYSIYLSHRDQSIWPDANAFQPDRFDRSLQKGHEPFSYVPFGGGPRNCIGAAFAQVEAKVILSRILQKYNLELTKRDVRLYMGATLEPRPGVFMRLRRRGLYNG